MGPIIILDKSTLEALSFGEMFVLHKYFLVNIAPVLAVEILGDLKKPRDNAPSEDRVVQLANKIMSFDSVINVPYKSQIKASLLGYEVKMDRRPTLQGGRSIENNSGEQGIIFEVTSAEKALYRWKQAEFIEAEKVMGGLWRESTRNFDLEGLINDLRKISPDFPRFRNREDLYKYLNALLIKPELQVHFLTSIIYEFGLNSNIQFIQTVFLRWETNRYKTIEEFAPYAFYCLKINLFFQLGLINNLFGTKSTNRVDLEYLYYLPFCMVFSSGDKFLTQIAPFLMRDDQSFVERDELKEDLKKIEFKKNSSDDKQKWELENGLVPPEDKDSITWLLWQKFMRTDRRPGNFAVNLSREQNEKLAAYILDKMKGEVNLQHDNLNSDNADFIIKKSTITANDYCPCGCGKRFKDCHGKDIV